MKPVNYTLSVLVTLLLCLSSCTSRPQQTSLAGVWANDNEELLRTDSTFLYFQRIDGSTISATLIIPSKKINTQVTMNSLDSSIITKYDIQFEEKLNENGTLVIGDQILRKVESIEFCEPYDMPKADGNHSIGALLQEWRLGEYLEADQTGAIYYETNTNNHMFIFASCPYMHYFRTAAIANNDFGSLFFQNIRLMQNNNIGEFTVRIIKNNFATVSTPLVIDNSKFTQDQCYFDPDGGIYWSFIESSPDMIKINGCGETYYIYRRESDYPMMEWIKYNF